MVGGFSFGVGNRSPENIGLEQHVGIGKKQPVPSGLIARAPHGVGFAHPAGRQLGDTYYPKTTDRRTISNCFYDLASSISGSIIYGDDLIVVVVEREQSSQRRLDVRCFVAGWNDDADPRGATMNIAPTKGRLAIPLRTGDIGNFRHTKRGVHETPKPRQPQRATCNPVEIAHSAETPAAPGSSRVRTTGAKRMP